MKDRTKRIFPAIISSFTVTGEETAYQAIPPDCQFIEAYCFMQNCLPCGLTGSPAVPSLAALHRQGRIKEVADSLEKRFGDRRLVALATFIPEITASEERNTDADNAFHALALLIDTVRVLHSRGHPIRTIELVSGSKIQTLLRRPSSPACFAMRLTQDIAMDRLIKRLSLLAEYAFSPTTVFLAVELEPGPLFIISSDKSIAKFCNLIDASNNRALKRCIGLNLDIPHWAFLGGISPEWLEAPENKAILKRVIHAHVSDHHIGHFCDTVPTTFNRIEIFSRWINFLKRLNTRRRSNSAPEFSGFVSCEMEACAHADLLQACYQSVADLTS